MKNLFRLALATVALPFLAQSASAVVLLTDNFTVTSNSQDVNQELAGRQTGTKALSTYTGYGTHHQVGNAATNVGQPGGIANSNFVLLAGDGSFRNNLDISGSAIGPVTISFDMYLHGTNPGGGSPDMWVAFTLRGAGEPWPVAGAGEFGMLVRNNGGVQMFQAGANLAPGTWDTAGFSINDHWEFTFTDTAGTGSAFNGKGSKVTFVNGATTGTLSLGQLNSTGLNLGFRNYQNMYGGIDNLSVVTVPEPSAPLFLASGLGIMVLRRRNRQA
jgi:hypothetical protein